MTANGGQYAFAGLAEGTYVVTMIRTGTTWPMNSTEPIGHDHTG